MAKRTLNRRDFLKASAMTAVGMLAASCAQPTPQVIEKEVPVEKIVKETVIVEKQVPVEKIVKETVIVERQIAIEKVVTATPPSKFNEAPMLAELVKAGKLPPVEERLPQDPGVVEPEEEIGQYGGTWRRVAVGVGDIGGAQTRVDSDPWVAWGRDMNSIVPNLVSKWDISKDGAEYTLFFRKGVKWSDGAPFTVDDLLYLQEDIWLNKEISPSYPGLLKIKGEPMKVEKIDDYTARLSFVAPYGIFAMQLAFNSDGWFAPAHYLKQFHAKYAKKEELDKMVADAKFERWDQLHGNKNNWINNTALPTLRPWVVTQAPPETVVIFERNPYYWKVDPAGNQLPYIDRQRYTLVEKTEMVALKAVAGEVDMQMRNIPFANYSLFKENEAKGDYRLLLWEMGESGVCVFPNQTLLKDDVLRDLIRDIRFRKALQMAIDMDEVNELQYNGLGGDMTSLVPAKLRGQKELFDGREYNPDKANALLDEMGLDKRSSAGWRLRPDGQELSLTIEGLVAFAQVAPICELIVSYWQKIGINAAFKAITYDLWWDRVYTSEYQVAGYLLENVDPIILTIYARNYACSEHSCYWAPEWGNWYATGGTAGEEPTGDPRKVQKIYDEVKLETDPAKQIEMMTEIMSIWLKNVWTVHTVGRYPQPVVVKNNFRNVPKTGMNTWPLKSPAYTRPEQYFFKS